MPINDGRHPPVAMATFSQIQPMPSPPQFFIPQTHPGASLLVQQLALSDPAAASLCLYPPILTPVRRRAQGQCTHDPVSDRRCRSAGPRRSSLFLFSSSSTNYICFLFNQNPMRPDISLQQMLHCATARPPTSVFRLPQTCQSLRAVGVEQSPMCRHTFRCTWYRCR